MEKQIAQLMHNETGRYHKHNGIDTQDRCLIYIDPTETYIVTTTSDGASLSGNPIEAANANLEVAKVLADNGDYYFSLSEKQFRQSVSALYFEHLVDTGKPMQGLCAASAFVLVNLNKLDYLSFSVGDCGIYAVMSDMTVLEMHRQLNGLKKNETIFTNSIKLVKKYGVFKKGNMTGKIAGFLTYSDGAENISKTDLSQLCASMLISNKAARETDTRIIEKASQMTSDDISYAIMMLQNDQTVAAAKAICNFLPAEAAVPEASALAAEEPACPADTACRHPEPETVPVLPEAAPAAVLPPVPAPAATLPPVPAPAVTLPPLLTFLEAPRTAAEMIEANLGFDRDKTMFIAEIAVLIRLDLITCTEDSDGKILFRTCSPMAQTGA